LKGIAEGTYNTKHAEAARLYYTTVTIHIHTHMHRHDRHASHGKIIKDLKTVTATNNHRKEKPELWQ